MWERLQIPGHHDGHEGCSQIQVPQKMMLLCVILMVDAWCPEVHSHSQGEGVGAASFVHHDRFAELSGDDTVSVLPQEVFVPQAKNVGSRAEESPQ